MGGCGEEDLRGERFFSNLQKAQRLQSLISISDDSQEKMQLIEISIRFSDHLSWRLPPAFLPW